MHTLLFTVPTFVAFLQDLEAPYEVKDYVRIYLGMYMVIPINSISKGYVNSKWI